MFPYVFAAFLILLLLIDRVFMPKSARKAWALMAAFLGGAIVLALWPSLLERAAGWLGIGRPVDLVLYFTSAILVREMFLSRARSARTLRSITELARQQALASPREIR
jgi:hypothetical protein